jgi:hypothetical protein
LAQNAGMSGILTSSIAYKKPNGRETKVWKEQELVEPIIALLHWMRKWSKSKF